MPESPGKYECPIGLNAIEMGEFFGTIATSLRDIRNDTEEIKKTLCIQNGRIKKLELWRSWIFGMGAFVVFTAGAMLRHLIFD